MQKKLAIVLIVSSLVSAPIKTAQKQEGRSSNPTTRLMQHMKANPITTGLAVFGTAAMAYSWWKRSAKANPPRPQERQQGPLAQSLENLRALRRNAGFLSTQLRLIEKQPAAQLNQEDLKDADAKRRESELQSTLEMMFALPKGLQNLVYEHLKEVQTLHTLPGKNYCFTTYKNRDGTTHIITGGEDGQVSIWDGLTGERLAVRKDPDDSLENNRVYQVAVCPHPNGTYHIASSHGHRLDLWNGTTGKLEHRLPNNVAWWQNSASGMHAERIHAWHSAQTNEWRLLPRNGNYVTSWNGITGKELYRLQHPGVPDQIDVHAAHVTPDNKLFVITYSRGTQKIIIWNGLTGKAEKTIDGISEGMSLCPYTNSEGTWDIAVGDRSGFIQILNAATGALKKTFKALHGQGSLNSVSAILYAGKPALQTKTFEWQDREDEFEEEERESCCFLKIWDPETGQSIKIIALPWHDSCVLAYSNKQEPRMVVGYRSQNRSNVETEVDAWQVYEQLEDGWAEEASEEVYADSDEEEENEMGKVKIYGYGPGEFERAVHEEIERQYQDKQNGVQ